LILPENERQHTPWPSPPAKLLEAHRQEIEDGSGVSPAVRAVRGYYSVTRRAELEGTSLKDYQRRAPALVAPMYSPDGVTTSLQIKPKHPRKDKKGKAIKYESPASVGNILDVHPRNMCAVRDASVRLWITEGCKKGDSLTSRGECVISLSGVWNWLRDGEPVPCWEHVSLERRETYIVFDSDVMSKPEVQGALERLVAFLKGRGARVQVVYLPEVSDA
jgi:putative DNA primase/helicase